MTALFVVEENGKYTKLTDINGSLETGELITSHPYRYDDTITLGKPFTATFHCTLSRKALRTFAKIMMMPKYKETEWVFPKKKKRGTRRRRRNYAKLRNILRNMSAEGYLPKGVDEFECRHWCGSCDPIDFCSYTEGKEE